MTGGVMEYGLNEIRDELNRSDLGDAELLACIAETIASLGIDITAEALVMRPRTDAERRAVLSCLALPQPRHPLFMPEHDLRPEAAERRVLVFWKRRPAPVPAVLRKR